MKQQKTKMICTMILIVIGGVFFAGLMIGEGAVTPDFSKKGLSPSWKYPFGTDWLGRNMLLRTLKGLSVSISLGILSAFISALLAAIMGVLSALGSKGVDRAINWLIDLIMGIPHLVLLVLISFACGRGMKGLIIGISLTHWTSLARLIRAEVLQIRKEQYIIISKRLGHSIPWIIRHHILPLVIPQFMVGIVLLFPHVILHESALSFLGYGLPPEQAAIGIILSEGVSYLIGGMWWLGVFPGAMLVLVVFLFDTLGETLLDKSKYSLGGSDASNT